MLPTASLEHTPKLKSFILQSVMLFPYRLVPAVLSSQVFVQQKRRNPNGQRMSSRPQIRKHIAITQKTKNIPREGTGSPKELFWRLLRSKQVDKVKCLPSLRHLNCNFRISRPQGSPGTSQGLPSEPPTLILQAHAARVRNRHVRNSQNKELHKDLRTKTGNSPALRSRGLGL